MHIVTYNDIQEMNRLYYELKNYAAVSRALHFSPATVRKYVDPNYIPPIQKKFSGELPEFDYTIFRKRDWSPLCTLSEEEEEEIEELWKELEY